MELTSIKQRFGIIGHSELLNRALEVALKVAPTDLTVLVSGESGVGKEFFPQVIHAHSARKHSKYIAVNCGAIPEGTIDSELFGHEKGSFTGAIDMRRGYFEEADGGTIFLDEVGELPLPTQVRLLRILQSGEFLRVGSTKVLKSNVRVVAATNIHLEDAVAEGRFREDLYYRLNTVPIAVPPLRERREDIYLLWRKFTSDVATRYKMPAITLDDNARRVLEEYYWRGNIRQLKNVAEQISAIEPSRLITAEVLTRYLPDRGGASSSIITNESSRSTEYSAGEREILYKVLFDMRAEIGELRHMVSQLLAKEGITQAGSTMVSPPIHGALPSHEERSSQAIVGLISSSSTHSPRVESSEVSYYAESEEIDEEIPQRSKSDVQREQITAALRRHNGRRREAAAELFMSERTLYRRIKELGIESL